jgi:Tfp pilus assembly protein PilN
MRVDINLASRKYEDVRRFFVFWGTTLVLLAACSLALAVLAYLKHSDSARAAQETHDLEQKIAALTKESTELKDFENRPENRDVTLQKQFWNTEIMRRSFSWTLLFNDLQRIMPPRVYVNSVQPELTPEGRLKLKVLITGETQDDTVELIKRMERSSRFHSPRPTFQSVEKDQGSQKGLRGPGFSMFKCEIETYYTPAAPPRAASKEGL